MNMFPPCPHPEAPQVLTSTIFCDEFDLHFQVVKGNLKAWHFGYGWKNSMQTTEKWSEKCKSSALVDSQPSLNMETGSTYRTFRNSFARYLQQSAQKFSEFLLLQGIGRLIPFFLVSWALQRQWYQQVLKGTEDPDQPSLGAEAIWIRNSDFLNFLSLETLCISCFSLDRSTVLWTSHVKVCHHPRDIMRHDLSRTSV